MSNRELIADNIYENGFHVIDNFLPSNVLQNLRQRAEFLNAEGQFKNAKVGRQQQAIHNNEIRKDKIHWLNELDDHQAVRAYLFKVNEIASILNQSLFLGLLDFESHFAIYKPGSFYKKHIDQFATTKDRQISCVYYLNEHWQDRDAGELKLYDTNDQLLFSTMPIGNRFICFRSDLPHEVCITYNTRYSIAGWMKTRPLE